MGSAVNSNVANVNTNTSLKVSAASGLADTSKLTDLQDSNGNRLGITNGDKVTVSFVKNGTTYSKDVTVNSTTLDALFTAGGISGLDVATTGSVTATASVGGFAGAINGLTITVKDKDGEIRTSASNALSAFSETTAAADQRTDGTATFQIGANTGQTMNLSINDMGASALGVSNLKISTQSQATVAIKVIDVATQKVSSERSKLGAIQNRLEHTINNLGTASENLTAAESRIRDVDMAKEMMQQTKNNILAQASQAMLAQANQQPQGVLQLLR
jgi:flagellin